MDASKIVPFTVLPYSASPGPSFGAAVSLGLHHLAVSAPDDPSAPDKGTVFLLANWPKYIEGAQQKGRMGRNFPAFDIGFMLFYVALMLPPTFVIPEEGR